MRSPYRFFPAAIIACLLVTPLAAQQGSVTGRVTDRATGQPLVAARIQLVGTSLIASTNADGRYRVASAPLGQATVRVVALGYAAATQTVAVAAGAAAVADFALNLAPYSLDEFVVTATGEQSRREVGNAVSTVDVSELALTAPVSNMGDLLAARAPGVTVMPGQITGAGSRVRIRGNSSISLTNDPIYVVDGVRIWSDLNSSAISIGGTAPSRVNDLNPEDIESIDVVRGPSAATLYGTDAANGVIVIKTKRGKAGKPVWNAYMEQGAIKDLNAYPDAYRGWRNTSTIANTTQCLLSQALAGACAQDSVSHFNLFEDPTTSPNGTGRRQQYGLQVGGGSDATQYYLSAEWEDETGYIRMPQVFRERLMTQRNISELPEKQEYPNALTRTNLRGNLNAQLTDRLDVQLNGGFVSSSQRLPQTDNNTTGLLSNALGGPGHRNNVVNPGDGPQENFGWRRFTPDEFMSETVQQDINRTIMSGTTNYRPASWLSFRGVLGLDFASREDSDICRRDECVPFVGDFELKSGFKENDRTTNWVYTGDVSGAASYSLASNLRARTTLGTQYVKERFARNGAFAYDLPPGATTVTAGATPAADESTTESATLGYFMEEWLGWRDRMFLTLAVRTDKNNAFGREFQRVYYPKAALSWVISDEGFFPKGDLLSNLRLRAAYGASGRQPGSNDAIPFYAPSTSNVDGLDTPSVIDSAVGNVTLKPERTTEFELGFDASLLKNRVNLEFTYYDKNARDALVNRILPPSLGTASARFENLGRVNVRGIEAVVNTVVLDGKSFGWDLTVGVGTSRDQVAELGGTPPIIGSVQSTKEGYPINGYWVRPYTYDDANHDGIIALSELNVSNDTVFAGYPQPRTEMTLFTGVELFGRKVRVQGNLDFKGGYKLYNNTERIRCDTRINCRGNVDPTAPLWEQARAVAVRQHPSRTVYGFLEDADFLRIREVSATWTMPDRWAHLIKAQRAALTLAGRNLAIFTDYTGIDPESGYFTSLSGNQNDFQTAPPPSYFTFRLNLTF
jgi:TonB-linked SusC/RagA family outer membrane protein